MKLGKILAGALLTIGLTSPAESETLDLTPYNTAEYTANNISVGKTSDDYLRVINASSAWARGYTGLGSKILIIDTGINLNHKEFLGSVTDTKDFARSRYGMTDRMGHGTSMASIAAANWNGTGVAGVAPDAMLAIAKVSDTKNIGMSQARQALSWGASIGADVANLSANTSYNSASIRGFYQLADGSWANRDATFVANYYKHARATGFYLNEDPRVWAAALGKGEMVLVNSAGNSGLRYPENPAPMAIATNTDGSLMLGGRMMIVGAWDIANNSIASYSNQAGHICQYKNQVGGTCTDTYRISDFYILAPGNAFSASKTGDLYTNSTGTSEAAAVVSGAVAIIHQQWPQMTGANIVKLLGATANKDLPGYNKEIMGQGLLDLEAATRPYGVVGIPTTGRGGVIPLSGGFSTNTSGGLSAISSKLSSVMVTDEFNRDYYVNMAQTANAKRARADYSPVAKATFYEDFNPYNKLNYYTNGGKAAFGEYDVKMNMNEYQQTAMVEMGKTTKLNDKTKYRLGFGTMNERNSWMGNSISGALGQVSGSYTQFMNFSGVYNLNKNFSLFGSAWMGYTSANMQSTGLVTNVSATESYSWNMGLDYTKERHSFGATLSQPVTVSRGTVDVSIPIGWTANGAVAYDNSRVNIRPTIHEYDVGMYYKYRTETMSLITYGEHQVNYLNQAGVTNNQVGMAIAKEF